MTLSLVTPAPDADPIHRRLAANHPLTAWEAGVVANAHVAHVRFRSGAEVLAEGRSGAAPLFITRGWAACARILGDGRRQILRILLPGDILGLEAGRGPPAWSVVALTELSAVAAQPVIAGASSPDGGGLARALAMAVRQEERQFLDQIVRLGRLSAGERMASLMMELRDRLLAAGQGASRKFPCPLTQEMLGDTLGLSTVHVNRVLRELREHGLMSLRVGIVTVEDLQALGRLALRDVQDLDRQRRSGAAAAPLTAARPAAAT